MYPYFRFTSCSDTFDRELQLWLQHFKERGIPACVANTMGNGTNGQGRSRDSGFAVWRLGDEIVARGAEFNSEKLIGEIVESVNGFKVSSSEAV